MLATDGCEMNCRVSRSNFDELSRHFRNSDERLSPVEALSLADMIDVAGTVVTADRSNFSSGIAGTVCDAVFLQSHMVAYGPSRR